jgi:hypothetical protein
VLDILETVKCGMSDQAQSIYVLLPSTTKKRMLKSLECTKIGRISPDLLDDEIRRVTQYEGWTDLEPDDRSINGGEQVADHILDTIVIRRR